MGEKNMKIACHLLTNGDLVKYAKNEDTGVFVSLPERVKDRKDVEWRNGSPSSAPCHVRLHNPKFDYLGLDLSSYVKTHISVLFKLSEEKAD